MGERFVKRRWLVTAGLVAATVVATMPRHKEPMAVLSTETWYLPEVYKDHWNPPMPPQRPTLRPTHTATPTVVPNATCTATARPTATVRPTRTPLPWPDGEVPPEVPYEIWLNMLEATRNARGIEGWNEVFEDPMIIMAANNQYGAQLSAIMTHYDERGYAWRGMETCAGLMIETPEGWIWFLKGYHGPIIQIWPRTYNIAVAGE